MTTKEEEEEEAKSQRRTNLKNRFLFGHMKWDKNWKSREGGRGEERKVDENLHSHLRRFLFECISQDSNSCIAIT